MARRHRTLLPPDGVQREAFELCALLAVLLLCGYAIGPASPTSRSTLRWLLGPESLHVWGAIIGGFGLVGAALSYRRTAVYAALGVVGFAVGLWACALTVGLVANTLAGHLAAPGISSTVLYAVMARRAWKLAVG